VQLLSAYSVPEFDTPAEFLTALARRRGKVLRGGIADVDAAARIVLSDVATFRSATGLPANVPRVVITNSNPGTTSASIRRRRKYFMPATARFRIARQGGGAALLLSVGITGALGATGLKKS